MPFRGVLISWLMRARNWLFTSVAAAACTSHADLFHSPLAKFKAWCTATALCTATKKQTSALATVSVSAFALCNAYLCSFMLSCQLSLLVIDQITNVWLDSHKVGHMTSDVMNGCDRQIVDERVTILLVVQQLHNTWLACMPHSWMATCQPVKTISAQAREPCKCTSLCSVLTLHLMSVNATTACRLSIQVTLIATLNTTAWVC